jgi:hypothetical protein
MKEVKKTKIVLNKLPLIRGSHSSHAIVPNDSAKGHKYHEK